MFPFNLFRTGVTAALLAVLAAIASTAHATPATAALQYSTGYLTNCTGSYYNNMTLSGSPVLVRTDPALNFFWPENTSPAPGIVKTSQYSVGWSCSYYAPVTGTFTLTVVTDDGMNVLIDGSLVLWAWYDQGPSTYTKVVSLGAGYHTVNVQYYNNTLGGTAQVMLSPGGAGGAPGNSWLGQYYSNPNLAGAPTLVRSDPAINFNWGLGSPDPSIPSDFFSVRWTRSSYYTAGAWTFTTTTDDGVRLYVDGSLVIDQWHPQSATSFSVTLSLAAGNHTVEMDYYEATLNAVAQLNITPQTAPPSTGVWHGQYFNNISLSGPPVLIRDDPAINFNWGYGSPDPSIPPDNFSIEWDSIQALPTTGTYTISATSDDGVAVWVNGTLVIDGWFDHPPTTFTSSISLSAGANNFHVQYYEHTGNAQVSLTITPPGGGPPPSAEIIVDDGGTGWQAGGCAGCWRAAPVGYGGHSLWTYNNTFAVPGYNWARWFPALPQARNYEVFAFIPAGVGNTTDARYWIYHNGTYDLAVLNQGLYSYQWVSLGTYYFSAAGGENVSLTNVTYECYFCHTVVFDAIRFSPR